MPATDAPESRLERAEGRLEDAAIVQEDREAIQACLDEDMAATTLESYLIKLAVLAEESETPLVELDAEGLDALITELGEQREWSGSTFKIYQSAAKNLADYLDLDVGEISTAKQERSPVDERDVLEPAEFHAIREAATSARDKALVDLLGYTGQRVGVIQHLKLGDVDLEERVWYMPEGSGFKGAGETGNKRPLLGALRSLADYVDVHPTGDPDDYLITRLEAGPGGEPGDQMAAKTIRRILRRVGDRADIDKPVNPHAFRHYFVTVAKTQYDLDDGTVKHLIGHSADSDVMETTYRHLSDEDHVEAAEVAFGLRDEEDDHVAPPVCPSCQRPLRPDAEACPTAGCSERFVPLDDPVQEIAALEREIEEKFERFEELKAQL